MSSENENPNHIDVTPVKHSGDLGLEFPVREYHDTPLEKAKLKTPQDSSEIDGLVEVSLNKAGLGVDPDATKTDDDIFAEEQAKLDAEIPQKHHNKLLRWGAATVASALIAAGAYLGIKTTNDSHNDNQPPQPDPKGTSLPTTQPSHTPNTPESNTPTPTQGAEQTPAVGTNEFDISDEQYSEVLDSLTTHVGENASATEVFNDVFANMNKYYAGGQTIEEHSRFYSWKPHTDTGYTGWNEWASDLYTNAAEKAMFDPGYADRTGSYTLDDLKNSKIEVNRIWANTIRENEVPYKMNVSFTPDPDSIVSTVGNEGFQATGTLTYTSNASESETASKDSQAIVKPDVETGIQVTVIWVGNSWKIYKLVHAG